MEAFTVNQKECLEAIPQRKGEDSEGTPVEYLVEIFVCTCMSSEIKPVYTSLLSIFWTVLAENSGFYEKI